MIMTSVMELVSVTKVIRHLEDGYDSPTALDAISPSLLKKASKEVCQYVARTDRGFRLVEDLLGALQNILRHNGSVFQYLVGLGLIDLLADIFQAVHQRLGKSVTAEGLQAVVELLLESANVLGDLGSSAKSQTCQGLCCYMLDLLQVEQLDFQLKMEVVKSVNNLLDQCPTMTKESMIQTEIFQKKIKEIAILIREIGDYEFQVSLVECLIRLFPRKSRQMHASQFIRDTAVLEGFLKIKEREFETDCRTFLNDFNSEIDTAKNVYSIPCLAAFVGNKELRKPSDPGYDNFWVDFNVGSQRMTLFCEQNSLLSQGTPLEERLWETVAIYRSDILKCCCCVIQATVLLEIGLKQRICELYPSQHQDVTDNTVIVEFEYCKESEINEAVAKTFCFSQIRDKASRVANPLHISVKEVQEMDSQSQLQENENPELAYQTNMVPPASQDSSVRRMKVSVPNIPMRTPASTPLLPSEQIPQNNFKPGPTKHDIKVREGQKVSSAAKPLKISTKENLAVNKHPKDDTTESARQTVISADTRPGLGNEIKRQQIKQGKEKEIIAPKMPGSAAKSKPKVKTPVVTVTPPAPNKTKKGKQHVIKNISTDKPVEKPLLPEASDLDLVSIPDSIPVQLENKQRIKLHKETAGSRNTTVDSGINMDVSVVSIYNVSTELNDGTADSLPVIEEYQQICTDKTTKIKTMEEEQRNAEENFEENTLDKQKRGRRKQRTEVLIAQLNSFSESIDVNLDHQDSSETVTEPEKNKTLSQDKNSEKLAKICNMSKTKAKIDKPDKDTVISNKIESLITVHDDEEDKFDFDSQQDKIPDSLEPAIKPKVDSKDDKPAEKLSDKDSITNKYSKILSEKGSKNALRKSIEQAAKYVEEEADARSRRNSGVQTPLKAIVNKKDKSSTDFEQSLTAFDFELTSEKKSNLLLKEKRSNRSQKIKSDKNLNFGKSSTMKGKKKALKENKCKKQETSSRSLRKRDTNKSYKEIDESDISFVEESQIAKMVDKKNNEEQKNKSCEKEIIRQNTNKEISEQEGIHSSKSQKKENPKQKLNMSRTEVDNHIRGKPGKELSSLEISYPDEQVNDARTDLSSDISEDYRFNNVSQDQSQDVENVDRTQPMTDNNASADRQNEKLDTEDSKTWNSVIQTDKINQGKPLKCEKRKNKIKEKPNVGKHKGGSDSKKVSASESNESENDSFSPPQKNKRKNHKYNRRKSDPDSGLVCNVKETCDSYEDTKRDKQLEEQETDKKNQRKQEKEKSKTVTTTQKREQVKFEDSDNSGHLKQCHVNAVSKKRGEGFVFQMSYSRSETNFKYNQSLSGKKSSKFSKGYDPYDFAAFENELDKEQSQNLENKNSSKRDSKPRKFFQHSRKDNNKESKRTAAGIESNSDNTSDTQDSTEKTNSRFRSRKQPEEKFNLDTTVAVNLQENSATHNNSKQQKSRQHATKKQITKEHNKKFKNGITTDSENNLVCSPVSPNVKKQKSTSNKSDKTKQLHSKGMKNIDRYHSSDSIIESDNISVISPDLPKTSAQGERSVSNAINKSLCSFYDVDGEINNMSGKADRYASGKRKKREKSKYFNVEKQDVSEIQDISGSPIEINSDDNEVNTQKHRNQYKTKSLMEQDPVTKKWYRKCDKSSNKAAEMKNTKQKEDRQKQQQKDESRELKEVEEVSEPEPMEDDQVSDEEEENCFSKIVKDIVASRHGRKNNVEKEKKPRKHKHPAKRDIQYNRNTTDSSFKEFDSEIVDCIMQDAIQTPCVSASLASTPKFGSASRKHYNPLDVSVIKTPVSLSKTVTFDDDRDENDSDKENIPPDTTKEQKPSRSRRRQKSVQYKDLSDEEIDRDERLSQFSNRKSISSLLDSSNNVSTRSEKSWILERKKTPKPKPKTYKGRSRKPDYYNSLTESSDENEEDQRSTASRSLSGRTGSLQIDLLTPSLSSLCRDVKEQEENENLILTPVTPLKLTSSQHKSEDDIEVYQTQENCTFSLNMDKRHSDVENMDADEMGNICLSTLGVKTFPKDVQADDDRVDDVRKSSQKKLKMKIENFLGDSGFASGPSSAVRPSRSTLKRKYPDLVECDSTSSDGELMDETDKPPLVPKKLFKFDHSSILKTVNEESDTGSTCSNTMEDQQSGFPLQCGLPSFLAAFGADIKKHFKGKQQKIEALTKAAMKSTQKQFTNTWMDQQQYLSSVTDDFQARMKDELLQLEANILQISEAEAKTKEFFKGQIEVLHNNYQSQKMRLDSFKKLFSCYGDRNKKVDKYNTMTHKTLMEQMRKEMNILQKKLIEETQKQELMNVRRGLQNLF